MSVSPRSNQLDIKEPPVKVLNATGDAAKPGRSAVDISKDLQSLMLKMKGEVISEDGNKVRYQELPKSKLFQEYKQLVGGLRSVKLEELTHAEKMAFFINIYNALTIHGLADCHQLPHSVLKVQLFWKSTAYNIGGHVYSLDDIEHGILRGNRPHPAAVVPPFPKGDPRLKFVVEKADPRIHFALVCGAKSCPAINVYTAENLERALEAATRSFCEQEISVHPVTKQIIISQLFQWYCSDFGDNDVQAIRWTLPYLTAEKERALSMLLAVLEKTGVVDIMYKHYDWNLNLWKDELPQPGRPQPSKHPEGNIKC